MATITLRSAKGSPLTNNEVDANFTNLNNDKYESGNNVTLGTLSASTGTFTGNITAQAYVVSSISAGVSAAGTDQAGGTALTKRFNIVTSATANQGVKLPDCAAGLEILVLNDTANNIKIYPTTGEAIDGGSANAPVDLSPATSVKLVGVSATKWNRLSPVIIYNSSGTRVN